MSTDNQMTGGSPLASVVAQKSGTSGWGHLMCGWPLLLIAIGGLVGGLLGAAAYGVNVAIYRSKLNTTLKVLSNVAVGSAAIVLWLAIAVSLHLCLR